MSQSLIQRPMDNDLTKAVAGDRVAQRTVNDLHLAGRQISPEVGEGIAAQLKQLVEGCFTPVTAQPPLAEMMALLELTGANVIADWFKRAGFNGADAGVELEGRIKGSVAFFEAALRAALAARRSVQ